MKEIQANISFDFCHELNLLLRAYLKQCCVQAFAISVKYYLGSLRPIAEVFLIAPIIRLQLIYHKPIWCQFSIGKIMRELKLFISK